MSGKGMGPGGSFPLRPPASHSHSQASHCARMIIIIIRATAAIQVRGREAEEKSCGFNL